jgi:Uma2 family endonuclease
MEAIDSTNPIHRISVEQFHRMIEAGVLGEDDRIELIDGEMRDMPPIGPPHSGATDALNMILAARLLGRALVRVQGALVIDDGTEVYPDVSVLRPREDRYFKSHPTGDDALLVVEVADSSLGLDLGTKLRRYARAGIRRYWVVDVNNRVVHDHRDVDRFGCRYRQLHSISGGTLSVIPEGVEVEVDVAGLFPVLGQSD